MHFFYEYLLMYSRTILRCSLFLPIAFCFWGTFTVKVMVRSNIVAKVRQQALERAARVAKNMAKQSYLGPTYCKCNIAY